jgi:hypothetical protein
MTQIVEIPILLQRRYANGLAQFQLPPAVHNRLQFLLDSAEPTLRERQDSGTQLSDNERLEAEGLVELAEFLSLLKLRSHQVTK